MASGSRLAARQRIADARPALLHGGLDHAAFARLDRVREALLVRILGSQRDGARIRITRSDPGQPEAAESHGNPADALEKLLARPLSLIHISEPTRPY